MTRNTVARSDTTRKPASRLAHLLDRANWPGCTVSRGLFPGLGPLARAQALRLALSSMASAARTQRLSVGPQRPADPLPPSVRLRRQPPLLLDLRGHGTWKRALVGVLDPAGETPHLLLLLLGPSPQVALFAWPVEAHLIDLTQITETFGADAWAEVCTEALRAYLDLPGPAESPRFRLFSRNEERTQGVTC